MKDDGVVINTVGIGSPQGANIIDPVTNQPRRDEQGNIVVSKLNQDVLQKIAASTNGSYTLLSDATAAATQISNELASMDKKPITDSTLTNFTSYYGWFVIVAILVLLLDILMSETKKKKNVLAKPVVLSILLLGVLNGYSQKQDQQQVRTGNEAYKKQNFDKAAKDYETALKINNANTTAAFNLGNTQYKTGKFEEATKQYDGLSGTTNDKSLQAKVFYNKGLSQVRQQKLAEAIQSFKQSLRLNPSDEQTRENLQKALNQKKQQDQQQQQNQDKKENDKKKDNKKDQQDKDKKDQQKNNQNQDKQQQPPPKINKQEAEQKLQALREEEKKLQQKLNERQQAGVRQQEKDW